VQHLLQLHLSCQIVDNTLTSKLNLASPPCFANLVLVKIILPKISTQFMNFDYFYEFSDQICERWPFGNLCHVVGRWLLVATTQICFKTCFWVVCKNFRPPFFQDFFSAHPNEQRVKMSIKKLIYKRFEINSSFSVYQYFPYFLDSETKTPPVTFHPYTYGETFWLGTVHETLL